MTKARHILLIDDQPKAIEALEFRLRRAGYRTTSAQNGELGLASARQDPPDAVILDVTMPELNGYQTCRELKKLRKELPVIIVTGKSDPADRFWAQECGADEFLIKPVDPAIVQQKLAHLLRE
jgi:DNA-binding response OmpR family regulator